MLTFSLVAGCEHVEIIWGRHFLIYLRGVNIGFNAGNTYLLRNGVFVRYTEGSPRFINDVVKLIDELFDLAETRRRELPLSMFN